MELLPLMLLFGATLQLCQQKALQRQCRGRVCSSELARLLQHARFLKCPAPAGKGFPAFCHSVSLAVYPLDMGVQLRDGDSGCSMVALPILLLFLFFLADLLRLQHPNSSLFFLRQERGMETAVRNSEIKLY
jgi:hypothetical protein